MFIKRRVACTGYLDRMPSAARGSYAARHAARAPGRYALALVFVVLAAITAVLLYQAYARWAPPHGHGIVGTWTASREVRGAKFATWFGDFAPADGGPVRHDVRLTSSVSGLKVGRSIPAATLDGHADAMSREDRSSWVPLALLGAVFAMGAGSTAWLAVNDRPGRQAVCSI